MEDLTLQHHGVKGQKWGIRRFQNKDGSLTPTGRKRRSIGRVIKDRKIAKQRAENLEKARQARAAKKEHEANKQKVLQSGSAKDVLKYKGELTQQEMDAVFRRIQWEQNMQSISSREVSAGKSKVDKAMSTIGDLTTNANTVIKAYNTAANIFNALTSGPMLPRISTDINNDNREARRKEKRNNEDNKQHNNDNKQNAPKQQTKTEKKAAPEKESTTASSSNKSSGPKVDFDKVKSAADIASKAYDAYKNSKGSKSSSGPEVVTGDVIGEGKSKRQSDSNTKKPKPDNYYDPIDMEEPVSSAKNSESASIGKDYVTLLLEDKSK